MRNIITGLLLMLMSTVGWGETYSCQYKGNQQFTQFLTRDGDTFSRRCGNRGQQHNFKYQITYEDDKELRLLQRPDLRGNQIYLNKNTGHWLTLYVYEPNVGRDESRKGWWENDQGGFCALVPE